MKVMNGKNLILILIKYLNINFREKFILEEEELIVLLNDNGIWRWFGVQFSVKQN